MQNNIIKYKVTNNQSDSFILINPTKQQIFFIPKEESQMFTSRNYSYTGVKPAEYKNEPENESENRDEMILQPTPPNASFTPTDYIGMSTYSVPTFIRQEYANFTVYNIAENLQSDLYNGGIGDLRNVSVGAQLLRLPANIFNEQLIDPEDIEDNNGDPVKKKYGQYFITVSPKFVETTILGIQEKKHFAQENMEDNVDGTFPYFKRRNIYECDKDSFMNTIWNFEGDNRQAGRLLGSVVEIWDVSGTVLKQHKVIGEDRMNFEVDALNAEIVLHPDNFGYDPSEQDITVGDIIRIYPRETAFNQVIIEVSYEDQAVQVEQVLAFMMNDVVRNMKTGRFEIYDKDGFTIDSNGNFNGNVIQRYNISQFNNFEIRKKEK